METVSLQQMTVQLLEMVSQTGMEVSPTPSITKTLISVSCSSSNQLAEVADRWTPTHASNRVPSAKGYVKYELYSRFIEDGSFLRLKNITLGYTFPNKWTRKAYINRLRVYGTAQNLFCLTKYSGYDPEVNMKSSPLMPGFDWGAYPKSRVFTFGVEVQF